LWWCGGFSGLRRLHFSPTQNKGGARVCSSVVAVKKVWGYEGKIPPQPNQGRGKEKKKPRRERTSTEGIGGCSKHLGLGIAPPQIFGGAEIQAPNQLWSRSKNALGNRRKKILLLLTPSFTE